jgi:hypothetical protein
MLNNSIGGVVAITPRVRFGNKDDFLSKAFPRLLLDSSSLPFRTSSTIGSPHKTRRGMSMFIERFKVKIAAFLGCMCLAVAVYAAGNAALLGQWSGDWEGGGAGGSFNITLTQSGDAIGGKVDVGQDTGDYSSNFTTASLEGGKFKAKYDFPPEPQAEIVLEGTFEGASGSGTWTMVQKGGSDAFAAGTWTVKK